MTVQELISNATDLAFERIKDKPECVAVEIRLCNKYADAYPHTAKEDTRCAGAKAVHPITGRPVMFYVMRGRELKDGAITVGYCNKGTATDEDVNRFNEQVSALQFLYKDGLTHPSLFPKN